MAIKEAKLAFTPLPPPVKPTLSADLWVKPSKKGKGEENTLPGDINRTGAFSYIL